MKILFLNPPFLHKFSRAQRSPAVTKSGTLYYPLWLAYAAGVSEEAGFEIKLLDAPAENLTHSRTLQIAKDYSPDLIVVDTSTPSIYNDLDMADNLKTQLPHSFVLLVGTHVTALPEESLALAKKADAVARAEYDLTVLELAQSLKKNNLNIKEVLGISYRTAGNKILHNPPRPLPDDLDKLAMVSKVYKKHLKIKNYFFAASVYPEVQILTARGCPFKCFFCLWPQTINQKSYRARSPQNVLEEFIYIKGNLPEVKGIVIEDDTFTVDKKRVAEICRLLIANKVRLPWNANVRLDLDMETMQLMKRAGCYLIITGVESAAQSILENISKGLSNKNIQRFFDNAKRAGLLVHAAFMAGNPGETKNTLQMTFALAKKIMPDTVQFFPLMPYPGTQAYQWAREKGCLKINDFRDYLTPDGLHNCVIDLPGLSRSEILDWCDKSRRAFYSDPRYLFYKLRRVFLDPGEIVRTYKAFMGFKKFILPGK